ncbi:VWA domain-containing protein [Psychrobacillus lasiicapitis]|uniref:VWA domain-containing protein n=1 Tax=Psychrobacillus lasiicapitis TaxID=1636719 RepID=A0A544T1S7_9BACI|nr:VWA domain-containing protein [Psychrobacillus lasiicapitis]TQR11388.1 VWA domain-containing protein [Psychrobacillus lasiicapitis]GGA40964.1 VWA domain-containing protein [Psychrobacillus lasiicapitis]
MNSSIGYRDNLSVLNTDSFDKRRFKEVLGISPGLQKVRGEGVLPLFEPLLGDIWASLYKMKPEITESDVDNVLMVNKSLMERIMKEQYFVEYRNFTRLDDLSSAIATVKFGEKTNQWLAEQEGSFQKQLKELHTIHREFQKQKRQESSANEKVIEEKLKEAMHNFNEKLQWLLHSNSDTFSQSMAQAMQETKQVKEGLKSLLGGYSAGNADAELKKIPLRDQISLAEKIASNRKMKEIAEWAGRFKQIASNKQKPKKCDSIGRSGVILGNDVEKLLPIEWSLFMHLITRKDFLRRFVEGQTMQYEQKGHEVLGKGPIILCLDQSGSMQRLDTQSKGFALALISIARRQRRDFCLILFSSTTQVLTFEKGHIKSSDIIQLAQTFLGGGTNFELPLDSALNVINESRFKLADIVFVTDGEDEVPSSFMEVFNIKKKEKDFHVLSLVIGSSMDAVQQFADKVIQVNDLNEDGSFTAFEI